MKNYGVTYVREIAGRPVVLEVQECLLHLHQYLVRVDLTGYYYSWTRQSINYSTKWCTKSNKKKISEQGYEIIEGTPLCKLGWLPGKNGYEYNGEENPESRKLSLTFWNTYAESIHTMTKALIDNEVTIMAGTDANVSAVVPGFSLHDELAPLPIIKIGI